MSGTPPSVESAQIVQRGAGAGMVRVEGYCPNCGVRSLFVGAGQYVTCGWLPCADPTAPSKALGVTFPPAERQCAPCSCNKDDGPHCTCSDVHYRPVQETS